MSFREKARADDARWRVGFFVLAAGLAAGTVLFFLQFVLLPLVSSDNPAAQFQAMAIGAALAIPSSVIHLVVPRLLDRYDPEPGYALLGCYMWGAIAATMFSAPVNTCADFVGQLTMSTQGGSLLSTVISAPIIEELWKGVGVLGMFYFVRREFDGVVDGMIYATFTALGFAMFENIAYYARAGLQSGEVLAATAFMRGVLTPWVHPLFTAMTGIGFGIARESSHPVLRRVAPLLGYGCAVLLHSMWNGGAWFSELIHVPLFLLLLPFWFVLFFAFVLTLVLLVRRRGRILREQLAREVRMGTITQTELDFVISAFGRLHARLARGERGEQFARAVARLGLSTWHADRAVLVGARTLSQSAVAPLREEIAQIREQMLREAATAADSHR